MPDPRQRPDFQSIAERFANMLDDDNDPRPLVRIKNKKVARLAMASSPGSSAAPGSPGGAPDTPGFMHSTYRDKFRRKSTTPSSPRLDPAAAADVSRTMDGDELTKTIDGNEAQPLPQSGTTSSASSDVGQSSSRSNGNAAEFFDTFSQTLLRTFTPGAQEDDKPPQGGSVV